MRLVLTSAQGSGESERKLGRGRASAWAGVIGVEDEQVVRGGVAVVARRISVRYCVGTAALRFERQSDGVERKLRRRRL